MIHWSRLTRSKLYVNLQEKNCVSKGWTSRRFAPRAGSILTGVEDSEVNFKLRLKWSNVETPSPFKPLLDRRLYLHSAIVGPWWSGYDVPLRHLGSRPVLIQFVVPLYCNWTDGGFKLSKNCKHWDVHFSSMVFSGRISLISNFSLIVLNL